MIDRDALVAQLTRHEGLRLFPYVDTVGKRTIGCGRNLDDIGISKDEALVLLNNDINRALSDCLKYAWFNTLTESRQNVLINLMFNLGANKFAGFLDMISCLVKRDYEGAATAMLDSKWAKQVGARANELANQMRAG